MIAVDRERKVTYYKLLNVINIQREITSKHQIIKKKIVVREREITTELQFILKLKKKI